MAGAALAIVTQLPQLVGTVGLVVHAVEGLFGKGNGTAKKTAAQNAVAGIFAGYQQVAPALKLTGTGAESVAQDVSQLIDDVVKLYNDAGVFVHGQK